MKVDHRFSDGKKGSLSATYNFDDSARKNFNILRSDALLNNKNALAIKHLSVLSPTTLLESSFNFSNTEPEGDVPLMPPDDPSLVFTPGKPRIGEIIISSPSISMLGTSRDRDAYFQRSYSLGQNLTFSRGRHSMRVGYDASFYRYIQDTCSNGCFGSYTFRTLTTLPSECAPTAGCALARRGERQDAGPVDGRRLRSGQLPDHADVDAESGAPL